MLTLRERQTELETLLTEEGKNEYHKADLGLLNKNQAGETDWGQVTVKTAVLNMLDPIKEMRERAETTAGRRHTILALFDQMDAEIVVFTAARSIIDSTFSFLDRGLATACIDIADRLQTEYQAQEFKAAEADLYNTVYDRLSRNTMGKNMKARISTLRHAAKKFNVAITTWSVSTKAQVGRTLLDLFIESTKLVEIERTRKGKKTVERLKPSEKLEKWIADRKNQSELLHPILRPMLLPPKPWTTIFDGGYLQMKTNHRGIVKARTKGYREELIAADLSSVFLAVNALQNTAWRVRRTTNRRFNASSATSSAVESRCRFGLVISQRSTRRNRSSPSPPTSSTLSTPRPCHTALSANKTTRPVRSQAMPTRSSFSSSQSPSPLALWATTTPPRSHPS